MVNLHNQILELYWQKQIEYGHTPLHQSKGNVNIIHNIICNTPEPIVSADLRKVPGLLDLAAVFSFAFLCAGDLTLSQEFAQALSAPGKNKIICAIWKI